MIRQALQRWNRRRLATRREAHNTRRFSRAVEQFLAANPNLLLGPQGGRSLSFSHSGNAGDVIYALPCAMAMGDGAAFDFYLKTGYPARLAAPHPAGNVLLDEAMADRLVPLLRAQSCIRSVSRHAGQPIDVDLDLFRHSPVDSERGSIARWYCAVHAVSLDLASAWLHVDPLPGLDDMVVVARSARYRNPTLDYRCLGYLPRLGFVGLVEEFADMRRILPSLEFVETTDFLQLARVIRSCRLFVGNQSLPFAIAEALKVRRILEVYNRLPNVIPEGPGGYEAWMQPQFEFLVKHCLETAGPAGPN